MSNRSFIEALDEALALLEQGYPFEYCVRQFPEYEDRLRPLLQVGADLRRVANTTNAALQKAQVEPDWERLLADVPQQQVSYIDSLRSTLASFCRTYSGGTAQRYVVLAAMLVFICITSLGGIFATLQSEPGDALYALRPGAEQLVLTATRLDPDTQHQLNISFAVQNVESINVLVRQNQPIPQGTIQEALGRVKAAIAAAKQSEDQTQLNPQLKVLQEQLQQLKQHQRSTDVESDSLAVVEQEIDSLHNEVAALLAPTSVVAAVRPGDSSVTTDRQPSAAALVAEQPTQHSGTTTPAAPTRSSTPAEMPSDEPPATGAGGQTPLPTDDVAVGGNPTNTPSEPPTTVAEEPTQAPTDTVVPADTTAAPPPSPTATETPPPATATETPTPSPEPSPTPTPSPTAEPEPTPSPTAEPEPTPSPTAAPTMTPEPTPTPSPTPTELPATPTNTAQMLSTTTPTPLPTEPVPEQATAMPLPTEPVPEQATATPPATETPPVPPTETPTPDTTGEDGVEDVE